MKCRMRRSGLCGWVEGEIIGKDFEGNEDWIAREKGRIRSKGAAAAERASAGLGTLGDDDALRQYDLPPRTRPIKPLPTSSAPDKR
jgi:hypothetical protein